MSTLPHQKTAPYGTYALKGYQNYLLHLSQNLRRSWINMRLGLIIRKLVLQNKIQIVDAEVMGIKARFHPLDNLGDRYLLFLPHFYDHIEFNLLAKKLRPDDVFLDIGANVGMYSLWAAKFIKSRRHILSLEPNPNAYQRLTFNISLNDPHGVIVPLNIGVADRETSFELYVDPRNLGGGTMVDHPPGYTKVNIDCKPLTTILQEQGITKIDVMKIDIEGAEALALNQFFKDAPRSMYPKLILIETPDHIDFAGLGYKFVQRSKTHNSIYTLD